MVDFSVFHFLAQSDGVARCVLGSLLAMSMLSWYAILSKSLQLAIAKRLHRRFLEVYGSTATPLELKRKLLSQRAPSQAGAIAQAGFFAWQRWRQTGIPLMPADSADDFLDRALYRETTKIRKHQEKGLAVLAAVATTSPFIGLFGTVCGIYRALLVIGEQGQSSLDKVAGPIGEALIMTAIGLVVAIPAALAYNALVRSCQVAMSDLNDFAQDFHAFLVTGVPSHTTVKSMPNWSAVEVMEGTQ